jgi:hypothetical protein
LTLRPAIEMDFNNEHDNLNTISLASRIGDLNLLKGDSHAKSDFLHAYIVGRVF